LISKFYTGVNRMAGKAFFASPDRKDEEETLADSRELASRPDLELVLKAVPECAAVLNDCRQILLANDPLLALLGAGDIEEIVGCRPGEALGCVHALECQGGCGTSESCRYCGAVEAIIEAQETGEKVTHECRVTVDAGGEVESLDLSVTANPVTVDDHRLVLLTLTDISDAKRRRSLEKVFFHDILNTATALYGLMELLMEYEEGDVKYELEYLVNLCDRLVGEISAQRDLVAAESGELLVLPAPVDVGALLDEAASQFRRGEMDERKAISVQGPEGTLELTTDHRLLFRIVTNMLKNALEATPENGTVTAGADRADGGARVWVRNPGAMPRDVQLQVFQRSFSTKGSSRGLGTYGMKLIGERYLKSEVAFTTSEREGTEFSITLPATVSL
jgi:signal transduction histidine kinase